MDAEDFGDGSKAREQLGEELEKIRGVGSREFDACSRVTGATDSIRESLRARSRGDVDHRGARVRRLVEYLSAFVLFVARCGSVEFKYRGFCIPARASFLASIFPGVRGTASYYL